MSNPLKDSNYNLWQDIFIPLQEKHENAVLSNVI